MFDLVQHTWTALFGVPFPQPAPQERWLCPLKTMLEKEHSEGCTRPPTRAIRQLGRPIDEGMPRDAAEPEGQAAPPLNFNLAW